MQFHAFTSNKKSMVELSFFFFSFKVFQILMVGLYPIAIILHIKKILLVFCVF